jgi:hypothetical protein
MKRKLLNLFVVLTLVSTGYCKPPVEDCKRPNNNPAICKGYIGPKLPVIVKPK